MRHVDRRQNLDPPGHLPAVTTPVHQRYRHTPSPWPRHHRQSGRLDTRSLESRHPSDPTPKAIRPFLPVPSNAASAADLRGRRAPTPATSARHRRSPSDRSPSRATPGDAQAEVHGAALYSLGGRLGALHPGLSVRCCQLDAEAAAGSGGPDGGEGQRVPALPAAPRAAADRSAGASRPPRRRRPARVPRSPSDEGSTIRAGVTFDMYQGKAWSQGVSRSAAASSARPVRHSSRSTDRGVGRRARRCGHVGVSAASASARSSSTVNASGVRRALSTLASDHARVSHLVGDRPARRGCG